mmetsp:Transcript_8061/g.21832  ORF Transcript_8061/g.21832 Transcript_8061/m.21832 type:complete len:299 (-) Transcript_8061:66-962(-)
MAYAEHERLDQDQPATALQDSMLESRNYANLAAYVLNSVITYTSLTGIFGETNADLSKKYQTLVTPAGWAFAIWGPIFIWEGVFAVGQMLPRFRGSEVVRRASPWWWGACLCQCAWTLAFAQEVIPLALLLMFGILACLVGIVGSTDGLLLTWAEYLCLRAPFCLHLGWIICASAVNANVQFDAAKADASELLAVAVLSFVAIVAANVALVTTATNPDAITSLVAAWAFAAVSSELADGELLRSKDRHNWRAWDPVVTGGLGNAAAGAAVVAVALGVVALVLPALRGWRRGKMEATSA